jgi:hypothetical protein
VTKITARRGRSNQAILFKTVEARRQRNLSAIDMRNIVVQSLAAIQVFAAFSSGHAAEQTPAFPFTPEQFMSMYNAHLGDGDDRIVSIKKSTTEARAILSDKNFQAGILELKKMDVVNGNFPMNIKILMPTNKNGLVASIIISGTRSDPANMMRTAGAIMSVYEILNPGVKEKEATAFTFSLGLMRGDADPTIGTPIVQLSKGAQFTCNNQDSNVSTVFGCAISPRF